MNNLETKITEFIENAKNSVRIILRQLDNLDIELLSENNCIKLNDNWENCSRTASMLFNEYNWKISVDANWQINNIINIINFINIERVNNSKLSVSSSNSLLNKNFTLIIKLDNGEHIPLNINKFIELKSYINNDHYLNIAKATLELFKDGIKDTYDNIYIADKYDNERSKKKS